MRASYDSIDNKQKMCEKVNKDITFIQFFHSTRLHSTELFKIFFSLLTTAFLQKASWRGKNTQSGDQKKYFKLRTIDKKKLYFNKFKFAFLVKCTGCSKKTGPAYVFSHPDYNFITMKLKF